MKFNELQINMHQFYTLGIVCFIFICLGSTYSLFNNWELLNWGGRTSSIFYVIFYGGMIFFFNHLYQSTPKISKDEMPTEKELSEFMEGLK